MMESKRKIECLFDRVEGPIPWLEIAVDEAVVLRGLGRDVSPALLESTLPVDVSWEDKVAFAVSLGLDAIGLYHWDSFGSIEDDTHPVLQRTPLILNRSDLPKLEIPSPTREELLPEVLRAHKAIGDSGLALFVEFSSCVEFAMADVGFLNLCENMFDDPGFVEEVLDRYTDYTSTLVDIYNSMPEIDFFWIGDDVAYKSGPFLSPGMLRQHVFPHIEKVVHKIAKPWVFHSDGDLTLLVDDILSWGPSAVHPIEGNLEDLCRFKTLFGHRAAVIGNLSVDLLSRGTPDTVAAETERMLAACGPGGGYGFSSGNALARYVRLENIRAAAETLRRFNGMAVDVQS